MASCLVVSSLDKSLDVLTMLLNKINIKDVSKATSSAAARRILNSKNFDLVLINTPLSDELGHDLCMFVYENTDSGIVLMVKQQLQDEFSYKLNKIGVMVIGKPLDKSVFIQSLNLALSVHSRLAGVNKENEKLHEKVEELKLVNRAKFILMDYLNMTESDAHHYIEKKAMNLRISKVEAAKEILKTYE